MNSSRWVAEDDIALIDAIHLNPRASFETLGPVLGLSPVTVARRWRRLAGRGEAWVSSAPGPSLATAGAVVQIGCDGPRIASVAGELSRLAHVASVHVTGGDRAIYALVVAHDQSALSDVALNALAPIPGVSSIDVAAIIKLYGGMSWTLRALDPIQKSAVVSTTRRPQVLGPGRQLDAEERALFVALQRDGRAGLTDLAQELDRSPNTVKRRLQSLLDDGRLVLRTDFVRPAAGWPVQIAMWLRLDDDVDAAGDRIAALPEVRVCAGVVSVDNLFVTIQLHSIEALAAFMARLRHAAPGVDLARQHVVVRSCKSWGRLLGSDGRATGVVPVNLWQAPGS